MVYWYTCSDLPQVTSVYTVVRKTVWEIADSYHILLYVQNGQCQIEMNGREYTLTAGDLFYIPANTRYKRSPLHDEFCHLFYVHFTLSGTCAEYENADALAKVLLKQNSRPVFTSHAGVFLLTPKTTFGTETDTVYNRLSQIRRFYNGDNAFDPQAAAFSLCMLLSMISEKYMQHILMKRAERENVRYPEALKKALTYIRDHYAEPISLADLCRVSFVSKQMLIRHFNKVFGKSPTVYIIEYKINRIKQVLVRYPQMSIKEICGEFGFDDQCYFSRVFKKCTGESPTAYRERVKNFSEKKHISGK